MILGMAKDEVVSIMGEPEDTSSTEFRDGSDSESLDYPSSGLTFDFGSEGNRVLDTVRIERRDIRLFDRCIAGISVQEALELFESHSELPDPNPLDFINDDGGRMRAYDFDGLGLVVWFLNDSLNVVQIGTLWEDDETPIYPWENKADAPNSRPRGESG